MSNVNPLSEIPNAETIVRTGATYARDLGERILWTFLGAFIAVATAAGPADMFSVSFWQTAATAGVAAAVTLVKGVVARAIGAKNSASTAPGV